MLLILPIIVMVPREKLRMAPEYINICSQNLKINFLQILSIPPFGFCTCNMLILTHALEALSNAVSKKSFLPLNNYPLQQTGWLHSYLVAIIDKIN